tara:strand:+ start:119 stop:442 length:324 start_codon:yes stop_codon:yes gene_type:complete
MSQSPSIIKLIQPVTELNGGGSLEVTADLSGENSSAIVYTNDFQKFLTPNIIQSFKNPDITGGGNVNSGTPFGFFEDRFTVGCYLHKENEKQIIKQGPTNPIHSITI